MNQRGNKTHSMLIKIMILCYKETRKCNDVGPVPHTLKIPEDKEFGLAQFGFSLEVKLTYQISGLSNILHVN